MKKGFLSFCIVFTVLTITSSIWQLFDGQPADSNVHILNRAALTAIAVCTIMLFAKVTFKSKILSYLVAYSVSMSIVFVYIWFFGLFQPLHPDAYRDVFFNFTAIAAVICLALETNTFVKRKR
ncbi:MAG: hypothetical protein EA344_10395 [Alkalicoccus sp.]|uniref:Uncharacterized protein n=1 Tax=Alkalicoccus sp. TaxID=2005376 RepID=A0A651EDF0_9BACI|nr:MAG: hypothetical protein EA344_10395 [Alkalicoccus sp.]